MFDGSLPEIGDLAALDDAALVDAARGWGRAENAACARKQAVMAEIFTRRTGLPAGERELWWVDPEAAVTAELAAAQDITRGLALHQAHRGVALRDRLPQVAALFEAGLISDLLVRAIVWRTYLITDDEAMAAVDAELAAQVSRWGPLSIAKTEAAIDALVDRHDPAALRRSRASESSRTLEFGSPSDAPGMSSMWARMYAVDAALIQQRVEEMARSVCEADARTLAERRADALVALAAGTDLACTCSATDCPAAGRDAPPKNAVVHVVADAATITAATTPPAPADPSGTAGTGAPGSESVAPTDPTADSVEPVGQSVEPAARGDAAADSVEPATPDDPGEPAAASHREVPAAFVPAPAPPIGARVECEPAFARSVIAPADPAAAPLTVPVAQCQPGIPLPVIDASNLKVGGPPALPGPPPSCPAPPAFVMGGGIVPAPLLAATLARATVREVRHPGIDAPPEPRYTASRELADFVRCRDLTCRWPGCDKPAYDCDLDHTVPYPLGPTHASNLKCYCRFHHHLSKTFGAAWAAGPIARIAATVTNLWTPQVLGLLRRRWSGIALATLDACSGIALATPDACSGIALATPDACSGIALATADACSPAAAAACPGTALAAALAAASANCRRLTHTDAAASPTVIPAATAPCSGRLAGLFFKCLKISRCLSIGVPPPSSQDVHG